MFDTLRDEANRIVDLIKTEDKKYFQLKSEEEISNIKGQITETHMTNSIQPKPEHIERLMQNPSACFIRPNIRRWC